MQQIIIQEKKVSTAIFQFIIEVFIVLSGIIVVLFLVVRTLNQTAEK